MARQAVTSSAIVSVDYDAGTNVLELEFHTGRVYRYFLVPASVHQELLNAESLGEYFNMRIRNRYRHVEIRRK